MSYKPEEYIRLGMPAYDRDWSAKDMVNAAKVLASIEQRGNQYLPRYKSDRSGVVFARIISPDNFEFLLKHDIPLKVRMPEAISTVGAY